MTSVEADNKSIIVTGSSIADVYAETQRISHRCGEIFCSFTMPVCQADGSYVSRGRVVLGETI